MRIAQGVEWALHGCVNLAWLPAGTALPTARLAELNELPAAYLNKQFQALARAGIVVSRPGAGGGFALARPANEISVLDIVQAIDGSDPAFRCTEIRQCGPVAAAPVDCRTPCQIASVMHGAERAWQAELAAVTVQSIADDVAAKSPDVPARVAGFLTAGRT